MAMYTGDLYMRMCGALPLLDGAPGGVANARTEHHQLQDDGDRQAQR
jgi:hypothetical protein